MTQDRQIPRHRAVPLVGPTEHMHSDGIGRCPCGIEAERDTALARVEMLKALILRIVPQCFLCPDDGPFAKVDEDGLCAVCGADTQVVSVQAALAALAPEEPSE